MNREDDVLSTTTFAQPTGGPAVPAAPPPAPFNLLQQLYSDPVMELIFSEEQTINGWLQAEAALAAAQADVGVLTQAHAAAIGAAACLDNVDRQRLWAEAANVGYPILPLVRMIDAAIAEDLRGYVHYGATTQDIMDTGLALQMCAAADRLGQMIENVADALAEQVQRHRDTVMAGRTHAQQAVPTTFGAKMAIFLSEFDRHRERLAQLRPRICVVSLFGAGGTSAALGAQAAEVRAGMAERLGLADPIVPWHVARDGIAEFGLLCALFAATSARLAREVIDLSRTELGEVRERDGHHRGASSAMPQKANPISSEAIVGLSVSASALSAGLFRAMEAGHERAAGEWQAEWFILPSLARLAAAALAQATDVVLGLRVFPEAMRSNLNAEHGLVMAEAYLVALAPELGRERAHDVVYAAAQASREQDLPLEVCLASRLPTATMARLDAALPLLPEQYLGATGAVCDQAVEHWRAREELPALLEK